MTPPTVMSRPLTNSDGERSRSESDAVEVYAPAPPSVEAPPGMQERPGQYAQHKRVSQKMSVDVLKQEVTTFSRGSSIDEPVALLGTLLAEAEELNPDQRVILHCASGGRSALAVLALRELGYTNVAHLDGGFKAWQAAGKPVEP